MTATLVDTQALLWWLSDDTRLGPRARRGMLQDDLLVSIVSLWEIAIKAGLGKLDADVGDIAHAANAQGMRRLAMSDAHCIAYQILSHRTGHGDPFDRMLVVQALAEKIPILTADEKLAGYGADTIDARE